MIMALDCRKMRFQVFEKCKVVQLPGRPEAILTYFVPPQIFAVMIPRYVVNTLLLYIDTVDPCLVAAMWFLIIYSQESSRVLLAVQK